GTKRLCLDTKYYETFNLPQVRLVDLRETAIMRFTSDGIETTEGLRHFDSVVFATGFDAVTGALDRIDIRGAHGRTLKDSWAEGPKMYLGLMAAGFPNLFAITGPGSPSVLSNMIVSIEQHVDFVRDLLATMRSRGDLRVDADEAAQDDWARHVSEVGHGTLYPQAQSWYMGSNIPGKARVFLPYVGGVGPYRRKCDEVAAKGYAGFSFAG
ncbi:MAG: cyclohexanone monooxygenase, partial [Pseudomonadota bacterium]